MSAPSLSRLAALALALLLPTLAAADSLAAQLQSLRPGQWLNYEVALQAGVRAPCCFDWDDGKVGGSVCRLDKAEWNFGHRDDDPVAAPGSRLRVLLRRGAVDADRIRALGSSCALDAAGAELVVATNIDAGASVGFLRVALATASRRERTHVLAAIAHHGGAAADAALEASSQAGQAPALRRDAVFWLAEARGERGFRHVRDLLERETDPALRRHEVFALSISPAAAADGELRRLARAHSDDDVRGEALFWLAQSGDPQTEALVRETLARDASRQQRDKAVFALSQLPATRAIPALRELVEHGQPREVRKQALFWLAQVDDDAVLPVFDALLGDDSR